MATWTNKEVSIVLKYDGINKTSTFSHLIPNATPQQLINVVEAINTLKNNPATKIIKVETGLIKK